MKKIISMLVLTICILLTGVTVSAKELPSMENIDTTKVFSVTFSRGIDENTIQDNIYIADANNNIHKTKLVVSDNKKIVYIIPCVEYKLNTEYRLTINTNIKAATNDIYLKEAVYMNFKTVAETDNSGGL